LAEEAAKHVRASEERLASDLGGHPAELAVKSLVLIGMLEEQADPSVDPLDAWKLALVDPERLRAGRCREWQELANVLTPERGALLRNAMGLLRVGVARGPGLEGIVDGAKVLEVVRNVQEAPDSWGSRRKDAPKRDAWATALQVGDLLRERLPSAVAAEYRDIAQRVKKLEAFTGGSDAEQFLRVAKTVIEGCTKASQDLVPQPILQGWRSARMQLENGQLGAATPRLRAVDKAVTGFDASAKGIRAQLAEVLAVPKADVASVDAGVTAAAQVILSAFETVTEWRGDTETGGKKANEVEGAAEILEGASKKLKAAIAGGRK
jgi:hypothetical protein